MKIGLVFPQTEYGNVPIAIRDYAQTAEALGYSHVVAYDHVLGANPDRPGGWEVQMTPQTRLAGELALVPSFAPETAEHPSRIGTKPFGRLGVRWAIHPAFVIDASLGYRIEVARFMDDPTGGLGSLVEWDIRLGAELFVPWGALLCRAGGVFCE